MRIRLQVKYSDFVVGRGRVTITEINEAPEQIKPETPSTTTPEVIKPQTNATPARTTTTQNPTVVTKEGEKDLRDAGILNNSAIDLPKPVYPAEAKASKISGQVQVKVIIDETGKVLSAEATFGPEQLRAAAVEAAKRARFKPVVSDGVAEKAFGIVLYDFVAP